MRALKAGIGGLLVVIAAVGATLALTLTSPFAGGYRAAGLDLLDASDAYRATRAAGADDALTGPDLPLPVLVTNLGTSLSSEDNPVTAGSLGGTLAMALAVAITALTATHLAGWVWGLVATLMMLLIPGTLFHARTLGPEATVALSYALLMYASVQKRPPVQLVLGVLGLLACLMSSHESLVMVVPWIIAAHFLAPRPDTTTTPGTVALGRVSPAVLLPVILAPWLLFIVWPHLHSAGEGITRWVAVIYDPFRAAHPPFMVLGEAYDQSVTRAPNAGHGLLLFLLRMPLTVGVLAGLGAIRTVRALRRDGDRMRGGLFALAALATLALIFALNGSPYYNGTDGFAAALPMIALLATLGASTLGRAVVERGPKGRPRLAAVMATVLLAVVIAPTAIDLVRVHPFEPAYHNAVIGGPAGAAAHGMETRTDQLLPADVVNWMNAQLPKNAEVAFAPAAERYRKVLDQLTRRMLLREDIKSAAPYHATHVLVSRMPGHPLYSDLVGMGTTPLLTWSVAGVQHLAVYEF